MNALSLDVLLEIAEYLDASSLHRLLSSSKQMWKLRNDDRFGQKIFPYKDHIENEDWSNGLVESVKNQNFSQMQFFINKGGWEFEHEAMMEAAKSGSRHMISFLIRNGCESWKGAMCGASESNDLDLMEYLVDQGANEFDDALIIASENNFRNIIDYIFTQSDCDPDEPMIAACKGGHKELVEYYIKKGASNCDIGLITAAEFCHMELVKLFLDLDAIDPFRDGGWYTSTDPDINLLLQEEYQKAKRKWRVPNGLY